MTVVGIPIHPGINDESLIGMIQTLRVRLHNRTEEVMKAHENLQNNLQQILTLELENEKYKNTNQLLLQKIEILSKEAHGKTEVLGKNNN